MYTWFSTDWSRVVSRIFRRLRRKSNRTEIDPGLIKILPHVPEYEKPFTIRDQIRGMWEAQLPTPEQVAESVVSQGEIGLVYRDSFTDVLADLTTSEQQEALYLREAFAQFDDALRRICRERNIEVVTSTDRNLHMRITFRKRKG